jgi:DNA invertase Pin-like site-specific DNA recombinase
MTKKTATARYPLPDWAGDGLLPLKPIAYSYIRFSHPDQSKGDSLRRQTEAAAAWCERNDVALDTTTTLHDLGKSAFTGGHKTNPDRHALAAFLQMVEDGRVPRGSYLVVENLDRLSREDIQPALLLVLNLLQAGIRIVQLKPVEMVFDDKSDTLPVMMMIMELSRGHNESAIKSERVGGAWAEKKNRARAGDNQKETKRMGRDRKAVTARLPAWCELRDGKPALIPERAAVVRLIIMMAAAGHGLRVILRHLNEQNVPPFTGRVPAAGDKKGKFEAAPGRPLGSGQWNRSYLHLILTDGRAAGWFQPRLRDGTPDGDPIPDYFPAVVTQDEYDAARGAVESRRFQVGRIGSQVNVFQGLVKNALGGGSYVVARTRGGSDRRVLLTRDSQEGRGQRRSFPYEPFEDAVLGLLAEVDPAAVVGRKGKGADPVLALSGELARVEASIASLVAEMDEHGESPTLYKRLRDKEAAKKQLSDRLAAARREAAHPLSESWGRAHNLLAAVKTATDPFEARTRLRQELRRVVEEVRLLVVARDLVRLAAVQVFFAGDGNRTYLIYHRPEHHTFEGKQPAAWHAASLPPGLSAEAALDLRKKRHADALQATLEQIDVPALVEALAAPSHRRKQG